MKKRKAIMEIMSELSDNIKKLKLELKMEKLSMEERRLAENKLRVLIEIALPCKKSELLELR